MLRSRGSMEVPLHRRLSRRSTLHMSTLSHHSHCDGTCVRVDLNKNEDLLENGGSLVPDGYLAGGLVPFDAIVGDGYAPDFDDDLPTSWHKRAKVILPHVGLVLLTACYTIVGAFVFYEVERHNEIEQKTGKQAAISLLRKDFARHIFDNRHYFASESEVEAASLTFWRNFSRILYEGYERQFMTFAEIDSNATTPIWTFQTAIFFAITVVTTIGYGNPVPITVAGRWACILFALFGIPLTLITIADIGKFFGEHLVWLYSRYIRLKHRARDKIAKIRTCKQKGEAQFKPSHTDICEKCRAFQDIVQVQSEKRIPVTLVISILIGYAAFGALLICHLEPWSYFDSFYFCFITMTTVGFGDMSPARTAKLFILLVYIVVGLSLCTMCIDIVGVQYVRKIHYFGRKIQHAGTALAIVGDKAVYISDFLQRRFEASPGTKPVAIALKDGGVLIDNVYFPRHMRPFIPRDIKIIRYIDEGSESFASSTATLDSQPCQMCRSALHGVNNPASLVRSYDILELG